MRLLFRAGLVLGIAASAACKESIGPKSLANPEQTTEQMVAFDTLFDIEALRSFNALSGDISLTPSAPAQVARLRRLAAATNPLASSSSLRPYSKSLETSKRLRELVPSLITMSAEDLFPPEVDGKTYEWNITTDMYEVTARTGAPSDGVRFILYAVDLVGRPVEPLVEVGYVEFDDESTANLDKVHVRVAEPDGSPVYVDYTVSLGAIGATSVRLDAAGFITNGTDQLDFSGSVTASISGTSISVAQDVRFDVDSHDAHVRLWQQVTLREDETGNVRIYFSFKHGAETVTLSANFDIDGAGQSVNGTVTIKVDGGLFATCTVEAAPASYSLVCQGADSDGLNVAEGEAIDAIGNALGTIEEAFAGVLSSATGILAGAQ